MSVLELEHVSKRFRHGARPVQVLSDASLELHDRELIAVWGPRGSGRSTLLRLAAGIEAPDSGVVRFRGRELAVGGGAIAGGIAYCQPTYRGVEGQPVLEELIAAQLALGVRASWARARAWQALERTGARRCEGQRPYELDRAEAVRVSIARALLQEPALLLIDEPTTRVDPLERDKILELLRALSRESMSILMTIDRGTGLFAADRALSLGEGELRGHIAPDLAPVLKLRLSG
jgi:putative ABC transport system ATP-binding protein